MIQAAAQANSKSRRLRARATNPYGSRMKSELRTKSLRLVGLYRQPEALHPTQPAEQSVPTDENLGHQPGCLDRASNDRHPNGHPSAALSITADDVSVADKHLANRGSLRGRSWPAQIGGVRPRPAIVRRKRLTCPPWLAYSASLSGRIQMFRNRTGLPWSWSPI